MKFLFVSIAFFLLSENLRASQPPIPGLSWNPAAEGTVGTPLTLKAVSGTKRKDVVTYLKVRGPCKFRKGNKRNRRTLIFSRAGTCVVKAKVNRRRHAAWYSDNKSITVSAAAPLSQIEWSPGANGTVGTSLTLPPVTGTRSGDTVAYTKISGSCRFVGGNSLADRILIFGGTENCVVVATVERGGQVVWNSGNHSIAVRPGTIGSGPDWNPTGRGRVGTPLVLDPVANTLNNDVTTYTRVSGPCRFGSGSETAERTLTFTATGTCVVAATLKRSGYRPWNSGDKSITVGRGTLTTIGWTPATSGRVGESLTLDAIKGSRSGDKTIYTTVSGSCRFGTLNNTAERTLTFVQTETCIVKARLERNGYAPWESGERSIAVREGLIKGVTWSPADMGRVGTPLVLDAVTGTIDGDTVTYGQISGTCHFGSGSETAERTLTFTSAGSCVVRAMVERPHYNAWNSGEQTITVKLRELTGITWSTPIRGTVGIPLTLPPVGGTQPGDTVTYSKTYGSCLLGNGSDTNRRTLTFVNGGTCLVRTTVERSGHEPWNSGSRLISVSVGTLSGLDWVPSTEGAVGTPLLLTPVSGTQAGDSVTYSRVSGGCSFGVGSETDRRTLTFTWSGTCVVRAEVERPGYAGWESGNKSITVSGTGEAHSGVQKIFSNGAAFAALKGDGSVVVWGDLRYGGSDRQVSRQLESNVQEIFATQTAFAALKKDGSVVTWGYPSHGGNSSGVSSRLSAGVTKIVPSLRAFAALKSDGSVVVWGDPQYGGDMTVVNPLEPTFSVSDRLTGNVRDIFSTLAAFIALKNDGSVVAWGDAFSGGDTGQASTLLTRDVEKIFTAPQAVAALKTGGTLVPWGNPHRGGDARTVSQGLASNVTTVFSNHQAMAAVKADGSVVVWGLKGGGGAPDASTKSALSSGVKKIYSTERAFAALKGDGSVVVWGDSFYGGDPGETDLQQNVIQIFSTERAFAALKSDGSVVVWGHSSYGGNETGVASKLEDSVLKIFSTQRAFAALKSDGSVVVWGNSSYGGDIRQVASDLDSGVVEIFSTQQAFAALKEDRSVIAWGNRYYGGSTYDVAEELK